MSRQPLLALATVCLAFALAPRLALGQGQLIPIVTNDTPLSLPAQFGQQSTVARNQAGDVAVLDTAGSAVHLKMNGSSSWARVVQAGDEVPGLPGSRIHAIVALQINAGGLLAMGVELNLASGEPQSAIVFYNGASLVNVVDGTNVAPNSGGARFGRGLTLRLLNDAGGVVVTIPAPGFQPDPDEIIVFLVPNGGAPVRIAGVGDPAPGTTKTFFGLTVRGFNSSGEVHVQGRLDDFAESGEFIGTTTVFRKVVAAGDPNPLGGTFAAVGSGVLNNAGLLIFTGFGGGGDGLFLAEPNSTITRIFASGTAAPIPGGGTLEEPSGISFNDGGYVLINARVLSNPGTNWGVFRLAGGGVQSVVYERQPAPGAGSTISQVSRVSMNAIGEAAFSAGTQAGGAAYYFQAGTGELIPLIVNGGPSTVPGGGVAGLARSVLGPIFDDRSTLIHLSVLGGTTDYAYFLRSPFDVTSMIVTTSDDLPPGGQVLLSQRGAGIRGSGNVVGFIAMRPGGGAAVFVRDLFTQVTTRVAADGDPVQGTGYRFRIAMPATTFVNGAGQVALSGFFHGASLVRDGIALASAGEGVQKIAVRLDPSTAGSIFNLGPQLMPSGLNNSGQVLFWATTGLFQTLQTAAWVGVAGAEPVSAIKEDDQTTDGEFVSWVDAALAINDAGQVLARAFIGRDSFLLATPGGPVQKVVAGGDPAPGGGTFMYGLISAGLNSVGQVAFEASTNGGAGGGVFVASTSGPPVAVALNGTDAPGGGTFTALTGFNVVINDQADVLFRANLAGSAADSGRFLRRGPTGAIQSLVREGDLAPGTAFAFSTMQRETSTGGGQQLGAAGGVAFRGDYFDGSGTVTNYWYVGVDGTVEPVALSVPAAFGGGAVVRTSPTSSWAGAQYPIWARVTGGAFVEGVFLFVPPPAPGPNLIQNGDFSGGLSSWLTFATPDSSYIQAAVNGGVLEFFRVPPPPGASNQAVIFQRTGMALDSGTPLIAAFDLGNSSSVRKRISVLIHEVDFSDLFVCTFWLPPNLALTTYEIRTHTTKAWTNATIAFYAATPGSDGGAYLIDNVSLRAFAGGAADRTECVDPTRPVPPGGPDGPTLLVNGDFAAGVPPWGLFGEITAQVVSDVLWFRRPSLTLPAGVVLQPTGQSATAGEIFTATFELASSYAVRRRVTVLIHDNDFTDLAACTFWLAPGQAIQPYQMRMFATKAWTNATVSIYPVTADATAWLQVDNVTFRRTPGTTFSGTDCVEPVSPSATNGYRYRHSLGLITNDSATAAMTKKANTAMAVFMAMRRGF